MAHLTFRPNSKQTRQRIVIVRAVKDTALWLWGWVVWRAGHISQNLAQLNQSFVHKFSFISHFLWAKFIIVLQSSCRWSGAGTVILDAWIHRFQQIWVFIKAVLRSPRFINIPEQLHHRNIDLPVIVDALGVGLARLYICTVYDRIFGEFPAKNTVHIPYIYGLGQPLLVQFHLPPQEMLYTL